MDDLTPREQEVLSLLVDGLSNQEIARRCGIEARTVRTHCNNIYGKLGVRGRSQAAVYVWRNRAEEKNANYAQLRNELRDMQGELKALTFYFNRLMSMIEKLGIEECQPDR